MTEKNLWSLGYMVCGYLLLTVSVYQSDFLLKSIFLCCGVYWVCKGLFEINGGVE